MSVGYSNTTWEQVKDYFPIVGENLGTASNGGLRGELLTALHKYLCYQNTCFGSIMDGNEAKRVHFIVPIIIIVCAYFEGQIEIRAQEKVEGNRVHAHAHFEFLLKRSNKRICIVEAKKDGISLGKAQSLFGSEALCDIENLSVTYAIVTNFMEWCFLKNEPDKVIEDIMMIAYENCEPTLESVRARVQFFS